MLSKDLISPIVPVLNINDTADKALQLMSDYHLVHLPLLSEGHYLGLVSEDALLDWDDTSLSFANAYAEFLKPAVLLNSHIYDAIKLQIEVKTDIIPVINEAQLYQGAITKDGLLDYLSQGIQSKEHGGVVVISTTVLNYSLSQLARIFESEQVSILSVQIHTNALIENAIQITLKTNKHDLRALIASLERLNYAIEEVHSEINDIQDLQSNYDSFMRYLDV
jgi:acetoin utilization protein AcuB